MRKKATYLEWLQQNAECRTKPSNKGEKAKRRNEIHYETASNNV